MSAPNARKLPQSLRHEPDPGSLGCFRVIDATGGVWANAIPTEGAARLFANAPKLLAGYDELLRDAIHAFRWNWDLKYSDPDLEEFARDEGELEDAYPGAPAHARRLQELIHHANGLEAPE